MYVLNWLKLLRLWWFDFNLKASFIKSGDSPFRYLKTSVIKTFIHFWSIVFSFNSVTKSLKLEIILWNYFWPAGHREARNKVGPWAQGSAHWISTGRQPSDSNITLYPNDRLSPSILLPVGPFMKYVHHNLPILQNCLY